MSCSSLRGPYARSAVIRSFLSPAWCEVFLGLCGRGGKVVGGPGVGDVAQRRGVAVYEGGGEEKGEEYLLHEYSAGTAFRKEKG